MTSTDKTGLVDRPFEPLPLGSITPTGWLHRQLRIQADGLTGRLDEFWSPLADNRWTGGKYGGWERGPYYVDGLLPLAHLLDDDELLEKVDPWLEGFTDTDDDGWIGPVEPYDTENHPVRNTWPRFIILKVLRQHFEATRDTAARESMLEFCRYLHDHLEHEPLFSWATYRWGELVKSIHWLYEQTDQAWLLEVAETAMAQGYNWADHFAGHYRGGFQYRNVVDHESASRETHGVNNAMGLKSPALRYRHTGDEADQDAAMDGLSHLDQFHGQATGTFTGDEHFGGKDPTRGTELCTIVEELFSLEYLLTVLAEPELADRIERIAYNTLPAAFTPDMWAHQYDQQANQVICNIADRPWTNGPDANIFGLEPHYVCCTANYHQGWPKLASHLWMKRDHGLTAVVYAPSTVTTELRGTAVTITETTNYPFEDEIEIEVDPESPIRFSLEYRVPGWITDPTVRLPDGSTISPPAGTFQTIDREWQSGDVVTLDFSPSITVERRYQGAVTLSRGPLVFASSPDATWKRIDGEPPHADWEVYPDEAWNYGIAVDLSSPETSVDVTTKTPGETPFNPEDPPIELTVEAARVPDWSLDGNDAGSIPMSPVPGAAQTSLGLIPYGCTNLRITEFPLISATT